MRVDDFDYDLPENLIALRPAEPRDAARLLVIEGMGHADRHMLDLPACLEPGDVLVFNDTRVLPARLRAARAGRTPEAPPVAVEILLHQRLAADSWLAFARPAKRLRNADRLDFAEGLTAILAARQDEGLVALRFSRSGPDLDAALLRIGEVPLPPYIAGRRKTDARDTTDYQTIYAREAGAVAAPTAGLHFTERLLGALDQRGVRTVMLTLHVGAGTFLPVKVDDTKDHVLHGEWGRVTAETAIAINAARIQGRKVVAVGTTSLRLLESAASDEGRLAPFEGETRLFITPGYRFKIVDRLLTNFHLPRSTLLMLVRAFGGEAPLKAAYAHAIAEGYRFYSYGDASLISRSSNA